MEIGLGVSALIGLSAGSVGATLVAGVVNVGISFGVSQLALAMTEKSRKGVEPTGIQGTLRGGGKVPRWFLLGKRWATAGQLVYAGTWGEPGSKTPNAVLVQVIKLGDLPVPSDALTGIICDDNDIDFDPDEPADGSKGIPVASYFDDGKNNMWIKFYDGTQTVADVYLVDKFETHATRPWASTAVLRGCPYVIVSTRVHEELFAQYPEFLFEMHGIRLYDFRNDTTAGGSGAERWNNPATWSGDADDNPVVQIYNVMRGLYFNGVWQYGGQSFAAAQFKFASWAAAANECDVSVTNSDSSTNRQFRSGGEVSFASEPIGVIEELLRSCGGRFADCGGYYRIKVGAAGASVLTFTDGDVLSSDDREFQPFASGDDIVNGVTGSFINPGDNWDHRDLPPLYNATYEDEDGGRFTAHLSLEYVSDKRQGQRLMRAYQREGRRERKHGVPMPPIFFQVEPLDEISWNSTINGYTAKQFRVDRQDVTPHLDQGMYITEIVPGDYDWTAGADEISVPDGKLPTSRPQPQPMGDFNAVGVKKLGSNGRELPGIRLSWDPDVEDVDGIIFEIVLAADDSTVFNSQTDHWDKGALDITANLNGDTAYKIRAKYRPRGRRRTEFSGWINVTTPDTRLTHAQLTAQLQYEIDLMTSEADGSISSIRRILSEQIEHAAAASADADAVAYQARELIRQNVVEVQTGINASILTEQNIRKTETTALAEQITILAASVVGGVDFGNTVTASATAPTPIKVGDLWINTAEGNLLYVWDGVDWVPARDDAILANAASIVSEQIARADADSALASDILIVSASTSGLEGLEDLSELIERSAAAGADAQALAYLVRSALKDGIIRAKEIAKAAVIQENIARTTADSATATSLSAVIASVNTNAASIVSEQTARATADTAIATSITALSAEVDTAEASIVNEQIARAAADSAFASSLVSVNAEVDGVAASVIDEAVARASADGGLTSSITALTVTVGTKASTSALDALTAVVNTKAKVSHQASAPASPAIGDLWFDSDDANRLYRWTGTVWSLIPNLKVQTHFQSTPPTADSVGELWFESDTGLPWRWNGSAWVDASNMLVSANATAITAVEASAAEGTAGGFVILEAQASGLPAGYSAAYRQFLYTDSPGGTRVRTGVSNKLKNDGTSVYGIFADKFMIISSDTSTVTHVPFAIVGGVVRIDTAVIENLTVINMDDGDNVIDTPQVFDEAINIIATGYDPGSDTTGAGGGTIASPLSFNLVTVTVTIEAGYDVFVEWDYILSGGILGGTEGRFEAWLVRGSTPVLFLGRSGFVAAGTVSYRSELFGGTEIQYSPLVPYNPAAGAANYTLRIYFYGTGTVGDTLTFRRRSLKLTQTKK